MNRRAVFNVRLGGWYPLSDTFALGAGVFTDRSPDQRGSDALSGRGHFYGATLGAELGRRHRLHPAEHAEALLLSTTVAFKDAYSKGALNELLVGSEPASFVGAARAADVGVTSVRTRTAVRVLGLDKHVISKALRAARGLLWALCPRTKKDHSMTQLRIASLITVLGLAQLLAGCSASNDDRSPSDEPEPSDVRLDAAGIAEIERLADAAVAAGIPAVSLAILRDDQTITIARGRVDLTGTATVTPEHRFRAASIAKSFVASMILQLADEEKLKLTDTVEQWLPGILPANSNATLEQVMRLESGIFDFAADERHMAPYIQGDMDFQWKPEELVALAADHPPDFAPGEGWAYSNTNYAILAMIIEKISGDSLANVMQRRIAEPLGLTKTTMEIDSDMAEPFARGYLVGQGEPLETTRISGSAVFGNGNLVSTPLDIARFYRALVEGEVVSAKQLPEMFRVDTRVTQKYGMGLFRLNDFYPCGVFIGHDGQTPGYDNVGYSTLDARKQFTISISSSTQDDKAGDAAAQAAWKQLAFAAACR